MTTSPDSTSTPDKLTFGEGEDIIEVELRPLKGIQITQLLRAFAAASKPLHDAYMVAQVWARDEAVRRAETFHVSQLEDKELAKLAKEANITKEMADADGYITVPQPPPILEGVQLILRDAAPEMMDDLLRMLAIICLHPKEQLGKAKRESTATMIKLIDDFAIDIEETATAGQLAKAGLACLAHYGYLINEEKAQDFFSVALAGAASMGATSEQIETVKQGLDTAIQAIRAMQSGEQPG